MRATVLPDTCPDTWIQRGARIDDVDVDTDGGGRSACYFNTRSLVFSRPFAADDSKVEIRTSGPHADADKRSYFPTARNVYEPAFRRPFIVCSWIVTCVRSANRFFGPGRLPLRPWRKTIVCGVRHLGIPATGRLRARFEATPLQCPGPAAHEVTEFITDVRFSRLRFGRDLFTSARVHAI